MDGYGHSQTATGRQWMPGVFRVACTVQLSEGDVVNVELQVAVIGGPLEFHVGWSVYFDAQGTFQKVGDVPQRLSLPNGAKGKAPHYWQFLGNIASPRVWEQMPDARIVSLPSQPEGATVTWDYPPQLQSVASNLGPEAKALRSVAALESGQIRCDVTLAFGGDVETVSDTTESDPGNTRAITIRAPGSVVVHSTTPGNHTSGIPNRHAAKRHDVMRLFDTLGSAMPGVCVQERFTTSVPQGFVVNTDGGGWETRSTSTATMVLLAPGWPDHYQTMSRSTEPGCFYAFDNLTWIWPIGQSDPFSLTHRYFAGTRSVSDSSQGTACGVFQMEFQPAAQLGDRGSVSHN